MLEKGGRWYEPPPYQLWYTNTHRSDATVTDPLHIADIFNDYFSSTAEKTKANITFLNKLFQDFLHHLNELLFIAPTDAHELNLIILSLNSNKSTGLNSLPTKILKILKNEISTLLLDIFKLSFSLGVLPSFWKLPKLYHYTKKNQSYYAQTIGQSLYYPTLVK